MTAKEIDGRFGEGGGQVLRTALALAAILGEPVEIKNIRGGRKKPGLRPQHLTAVKALALLTSASVEGAEPGSMQVSFAPRQPRGGTYTFHVGTAGSTSLVLQALLPSLFFCKNPSLVRILGGTHVPWSPCFQYLEQVFAPALKEMGGMVSLELEAWGWYPKGGGSLVAFVAPVSRLLGVEWNHRGKLKDAALLSAVSNLPRSIGERQRDRALKGLLAEGRSLSRVELVEGPSPGAGTVVFISARFERGIAGFSSLGARGKRAEEVAEEACSDFHGFMASGSTVDCHLADQLVLYMALAHGRSSFIVEPMTRHLWTNMGIIEQLLPVTFEVDKKTGRVGVEGAGFVG